jgi:hypothetical protein
MATFSVRLSIGNSTRDRFEAIEGLRISRRP